VADITAASTAATPKVEEAIRLYAALQTDAGNAYFEDNLAATSLARSQRAQALSSIEQQRLDEAFSTIGALADMSRVTTVVSTAVGISAALLACLFIYLSIRRSLERAIGLAEAVAAGDLTQRTGAASNDQVGRLLTALETMSSRMRDALAAVSESAESVHAASIQIAAGNADLSERSERQAASLQQATTSVAHLSDELQKSASAAANAGLMASLAAQSAAAGGTRVDNIIATMNNVASSSARMRDIVGVIDGIAFQTNILALNAAVEAARAGEQGRGFAVVATEVRTLAQRSAGAAREIKQLILDSSERVDAGNQLVEQASRSVNEIAAAIGRVTQVVDEITHANAEQASGVQLVGEALNQMDQVTQRNAALVEEAAAAAESMRQQSTAMVQAVSAFKLA
jgi:methyl-accepting chemotaxis protein